MFTYISKSIGLKIVIQGEVRGKDKQGNPFKKTGVYIQFVNGKFRTDDKDEILILKNYIKQHGNEVTEIDEDKLKREQAISKRVRAEIAKEEAAALKKAGIDKQSDKLTDDELKEITGEMDGEESEKNSDDIDEVVETEKVEEEEEEPDRAAVNPPTNLPPKVK